MPAVIYFCALTPPYEVPLLKSPPQVTAEFQKFRDEEHTHAEQDTRMLELVLIDVHAPVITGELIQPEQATRRLQDAANRSLARWWAERCQKADFCVATDD